MQLDPERTYLDEAPFGSMDPTERLEVLDAEGIDAAVLYTTIGLLWEAELDDAELSPGLHPRLQPLDLRVLLGQRAGSCPTAHLSLERSGRRRRGARAGRRRRRARRVRRAVHPRRPSRSAIPTTTPVFAAAQDLDVPFAIHPTFEPQWTKGTRMGAWENVQAAAAARVGARRPTACATSSRRCSTTACSTSSRG